MGETPEQHNFPGVTVTQYEILSTQSPTTVLVATATSLDLSWTQFDYDDSTWLHGTTGVGFDTNGYCSDHLASDLDAPPSVQTATPMIGVNASVYLRIPFHIHQKIPLAHVRLSSTVS